MTTLLVDTRENKIPNAIRKEHKHAEKRNYTDIEKREKKSTRTRTHSSHTQRYITRTAAENSLLFLPHTRHSSCSSTAEHIVHLLLRNVGRPNGPPPPSPQLFSHRSRRPPPPRRINNLHESERGVPFSSFVRSHGRENQSAPVSRSVRPTTTQRIILFQYIGRYLIIL